MREISRASFRRWICGAMAAVWCVAGFAGAAEESELPVRGASLLATLDGISPPRSHDYTLMTTKIDIVRTDVEPWQGLSEKDLRASGAKEGATYAIATLQLCRSKVDLQIFQGEKRNWYIVVDDKLAAWDHHTYGSRCVVGSDFQPASGGLIETERKFIVRADKKFPPSMTHDLELYRNGMSYLAVERLSDAEAMLTKSDSELDVGYRGIVRPDRGRKLNVARDRHREEAREKLVEAIALAKDRQERGLPLVSAEAKQNRANMRRSLEFLIEEPTDEDRARMAVEAAERDKASADRWEREKDLRLFVEVDGGWMLVEDWKRERGPSDGETWVTYEEMKRIKAIGSNE